jgi:hypothetical protein
MQHPFQLLPIKNPLYSFYTCDLLVRNVSGNKKKDILSLFVNVNALLFSMQYGHASFPCMLQLETIP